MADPDPSQPEFPTMFQVVAYEPCGSRLIPTPVLATGDRDMADRVYRKVADMAMNAGLETTFGMTRHDPAEPTGWKLLFTNRPSGFEIAPMENPS
jgi:hypothetical protein